VGGEPILALNGLVVGPKSEASAILAPFVAATSPTQTALVERTWGSAVSYFAGDQAEVRRGIAVASGYARSPLDAAGRAALVAAVEARQANPALRRGGAVLFALGGAVNTVAPAATAFVHRGALFSVELLALWDAASHQGANLAWVDAARASVRPHLSSEAVQNYADPGLGRARRAYYGANLERLVAVKHAVDPRNVFRHSQSIPVKL
jgi:FAD/FMN-containing dehydrogenase